MSALIRVLRQFAQPKPDSPLAGERLDRQARSCRITANAVALVVQR